MTYQTDIAASARKPLDGAMLDAWIVDAQPGARLVYYTGTFAGEGSPRLNGMLLAEEARGMLYLVQQRRRGTGPGGSGFDYIAIRSSRPATAGKTPRPKSLREQVEALFERGGRS